MRKQIQILMAGVLVIVPLAITAYVIWFVGVWLDDLGGKAMKVVGLKGDLPPAAGAVLVIASIYLVGLLTHLWVFRGLLRYLERLLVHVPGVKTIYQSVRDLLNLFGGEPGRMGRAVLYQPPGSQVTLLGILTNDRPAGMAGPDQKGRVAVYLPMSYMLGGPTVYVPAEHLRDADVSVEQALKLSATANVGGNAPPTRTRPE